MKKILFNAQSKGGSGKSVLTFLLAEYYKKAIILDLDEATKTSSLQLKYRKPKEVSFMNADKNIDRGLFDTFMETISQAKSDFFICDLGGTTSEQLPLYFTQMGGMLKEILTDLKIVLELNIVVSGGNNFVQTLKYLDDVVTTSKKSFKIRVFKNEYYDFTSDQSNALREYCNLQDLELIPFTISTDRNETTQNRIIQVLNSGNGTGELSGFSKLYFNQAIERLSAALGEQAEEKVQETAQE